ncbi:hypothetical protein [Azotosporobacter soli]
MMQVRVCPGCGRIPQAKEEYCTECGVSLARPCCGCGCAGCDAEKEE